MTLDGLNDDFRDVVLAFADGGVEFLYLSGSVVNGQLTGTWNFPRPSSTNSVLLWRTLPEITD